MILKFASVFLILMLVLFFFFFIFRIRLNFLQIRLIWWIFIISLATFAYYAEPSVTDDLYRHYRNMDDVWTGVYDTPFVVWKMILVLVSLTGHKGLLPALSILAIGGSAYGIMKVYRKSMENVSRIFPLYAIYIFGFCSIFSMISGIRNSVVAAVWSYAYIKHYKNNRKRFYIIIVFISLIHLAPLFPTFILIITELVNRIRNKAFQFFTLFVVGFWPIIMQVVLILFSNVSIEYVQLIIRKNRGYFDFDNRILFHNHWYGIQILLCILMFLLVFMIQNKMDQRIYKFMILFMFSITTNTFWYSIILNRMLMFIGFLSVPILGNSYKIKHKVIINILAMTCMIMCLYYANSLIAHVTFSGMDFYTLFGRKRL